MTAASGPLGTTRPGSAGVTERLQLTAERAPFVMLPRWLLYHRDVGEGAKFLYCVLHDLVAGREGPTRPVTRSELAGRCGVSANTIDRRLAELVDAGAVEKEPQILAGGQVGNIYRVWLTPPEQRCATRFPTDGEARSERFPVDGEPVPSPATAVDNRFPAGGEARSERVVTAGDPPRTWGGSLPAGGEPSVFEEPIEEGPPQPPRRAGGHEVDKGTATPACSATHMAPLPETTTVESRPTVPESFPRPLSLPVDGERRTTRRRARALGTNPRADADRAEAARLEAESEARRAELERAARERRTAERAAEVEADRLAAESLAISACLDDATLADVVVTVREGLAGPLAASPLAIARAVVGWCRIAADVHGAVLVDAVAAALAAGLAAGEGTAAPPLVLPPVPPDTPSLRARIAGLLKPVEAV